MEFRTKYERQVVTTEPGSPIADMLAAEYDKNHILNVVKKGEINLYESINSHAESVDIHVLLARFINGDKESLLQRAGAYIDLSSMPTNINEFLELSRNAENIFATLPVEVKQKFNNNYVEFIATYGDDEWLKKMETSEYQIKKDISDDFKADTAAHVAAIKQKNSVYGDVEVQIESEADPKTNPITGNEVKRK